MRESIRVSAPGKLMLLGEHAVLHDKHALVCAVDQRMRLTLTPKPDNTLTIHSELGTYTTVLPHLEADSRFRFLIAACSPLIHEWPSGVELTVQSDFNHRVGLGSSAAVTVAAVAALAAWLEQDLSPASLLQSALQIVHAVQGTGSGADIAAAVYGGVLLYHSRPARVVTSLPAQVPLTAVYSGAKTPTVEVIRRVQSLHRTHPLLVEAIFDLMEQSVLEAAEAWKRGNHAAVGEIFNINQGLMDSLGLNTPALNEIVYALRQRPGIYGAKISGSGLGDCVVGLGEAEAGDLPGERLPLRISKEGVKFD